MRPDFEKAYQNIIDENADENIAMDPAEAAIVRQGLEDLSKEPSIQDEKNPIDSYILQFLAPLMYTLAPKTGYVKGTALKMLNAIRNGSPECLTALKQKILGPTPPSVKDLQAAYKALVDSTKSNDEKTDDEDAEEEAAKAKKAEEEAKNTKKAEEEAKKAEEEAKKAKKAEEEAKKAKKAEEEAKKAEEEAKKAKKAEEEAKKVADDKNAGAFLATLISEVISKKITDPTQADTYNTQLANLCNQLTATDNSTESDKIRTQLADLLATLSKIDEGSDDDDDLDIPHKPAGEDADKSKVDADKNAGANLVDQISSLISTKITDPTKADTYNTQLDNLRNQLTATDKSTESTKILGQLNDLLNEIKATVPEVGVGSTERVLPHKPIIKKPAVEDPVVEDPPVAEELADYRTTYKPVYDLVDTYAMSTEQANTAKRYIDTVFANQADFPTEYSALTGRPGQRQTKFITGLLTHIDPKLGYKGASTSPSDSTIPFDNGTVTQSRAQSAVQNALVMPSGFGQKKNTVLWNTPVITDFGFPFLNFSSEAMLHIIKSTDTDENIKNADLKAMFKDAAKKLGGVWKAIYASPLALLRQIASEIGTKCTPNYIKVDGNDLLDSDSGDTVTVFPIKYYSIEPAYEQSVQVPRDFLSSFYEVMDYSTTSKKTYLKYAFGMSAEDFAEEIDENGGIPPFYILVPKAGKFSKCEINPGSLFGSLLNLILGRKKCTMVKTMFMGKRGCLAMETDIADKLYADT